MSKSGYEFYEKRVGETPLASLSRFREEFPQYKDSKLAYAGRLDPLASGKLLILIDDECKNRDHYQGLDKEYTFELLLGVRSDTGDIMGELEWTGETDFLEENLRRFRGPLNQKYPIYSSKAVNGTPLWVYAKENRIEEIEIPTHEVKIYELKLLEKKEVSLTKIADKAIQNIEKVSGDFRQELIISQWQQFKQDNQNQKLPIIKLKAKVSSGTYIRQLCLDLGGLAYSIHRDQVFLDAKT